MSVCGPKTAACCTILSTWGLLQLGATGLAMYLKRWGQWGRGVPCSAGPLKLPPFPNVAALLVDDQLAFNA